MSKQDKQIMRAVKDKSLRTAMTVENMKAVIDGLVFAGLSDIELNIVVGDLVIPLSVVLSTEDRKYIVLADSITADKLAKKHGLKKLFTHMTKEEKRKALG